MNANRIGNLTRGVVLMAGFAIGHPDTYANLDATSESNSDLAVAQVAVPTGTNAMFPDVTVGSDNTVYVSWLEPVDDRGHRLMVTRWSDNEFTTPVQVASGDNWFVNWADFPTLHAGPEGKLIVHWLERLGESTYAYGVRIARSENRGENWTDPVWLHDDRTLNEHGFVSMAPMEDGSFWAVWLDSRNMARTGNMALLARQIHIDGTLGPEVELDDRVCSCCQTTASQIDGRVVVSYRDRTDDETRDISKVVWTNEKGWGDPTAVAHDGWVNFT